MGTLRIIGKELASVKENIPFNLAASYHRCSSCSRSP